MPPEDEVRIRHLVEAAATAVRFIEGRDRTELDDDEMLRLASRSWSRSSVRRRNR